MARSRRVRQARTDELELELVYLMNDFREGVPIEGARASRWRRVARELARRDYRFRSHGQRCQCADCWYLWEVWTGLWRRADEEFTPELEDRS